MKIKQFFPLIVATGLIVSGCAKAQNNAPINYNSATYPDVITAAQQVGFPFLLVQGYPVSAPGYKADTAKSTVTFGGKTYKVKEEYTNPGGANPYFIMPDEYNTYRISKTEQKTWPTKIQNIMFDPDSAQFCSYVDCVGYGSRLLSLTDSDTAGWNAYTRLRSAMRQQGVSPFAQPGYEASAYEYAVAFPVLQNNKINGWQYVSGNVNSFKVDSFNNLKSSFPAYTGTPKGGFGTAQPGDVLSFGYDNGKDNGHFMVIAQQPQAIRTSTALKNYFPLVTPQQLDSLLGKCTVYAVPLFDCSGQNVHFSDSRKKTSGIGHGTIIILANPTTDVPLGFIFSQPKQPGRFGFEPMGNHLIALTVGRYTPVGK